jgi:type IV secretion system protein VirB2
VLATWICSIPVKIHVLIKHKIKRQCWHFFCIKEKEIIHKAKAGLQHNGKQELRIMKVRLQDLLRYLVWILTVLSALLPDLAFAQVVQRPGPGGVITPPLFPGADLPWDGALETLMLSLTGPVPRAIGITALAATGCALVFGGELGEFAKKMIMLVMALSMAILAPSIVILLGVAAPPGIVEGGLPWEGPLTRIAESLSGRAARAIGVIAIAVTGAMLAFGGEMTELSKRMCLLVMAIAVMVNAGGFLRALQIG